MTEDVMSPAEGEQGAKKKMSRRQKLTVAGAGTLAGIGAAAVLAAWSGTAVVSQNFSSGEFIVEVVVNGGEAVQTTAEGGVAGVDLDLAGVQWGPGDTESVTVDLNMTEGSTHDGVLDSIAVTSGGDDLDIAWSITADGEPLASGSDLSSETFESLGETLSADGAVLSMELDLTAGDDLGQGEVSDVDWTFNVVQDAS